MSALVALCRARTAASSSSSLFNSVVRPAFRSLSTGFGDVQNKTLVAEMEEKMLHMDINSMIGSSMPLGMMRIGTIIHNIEMNPGQGAKLVRAAGTNAKILKEPASGKCLIKLPSGDTRWINARCRATIGTVSNPSHGVKKLYKAGQSRWLGIRPKVRGVAMNPCDHPHGGGEGKSKSMNCSSEVFTNYRPGGFEKLCCESIWPWGLIIWHPEQHLSNLIISYRLNQSLSLNTRTPKRKELLQLFD
ncbi:60S ribosomal protein L2, mitochondrial isoform X1 [Brassica rapa]|uniref:60S ribosomal protein L2, mitochondrial isoform X1 n=1 Tax=Brassica campestris TaxID=3711 RepID=UPI00142DCCF1|nr:60S ribosomal protein L2, mitochondrial isoform X1 [Brassica rapa]